MSANNLELCACGSNHFFFLCSTLQLSTLNFKACSAALTRSCSFQGISAGSFSSPSLYFSPLKQTFGRERLSTEILCLGAKSSSRRGVARRLASLCQRNSLLFSSSQHPASLWQPKAEKSNLIPTPNHLFFPLLYRLQLHEAHPSSQALLWSGSLPTVSAHNRPPICRSGSKLNF